MGTHKQLLVFAAPITDIMSNLTPKQLEEEVERISDESFELHQELADIVQRSAVTKLELMRECKSGKEVEMKYDATADGRREAYLKIYLKGLSHKRTALILEYKANAGTSW
jgi:hypothetical protein